MVVVEQSFRAWLNAELLVRGAQAVAQPLLEEARQNLRLVAPSLKAFHATCAVLKENLLRTIEKGLDKVLWDEFADQNLKFEQKVAYCKEQADLPVEVRAHAERGRKHLPARKDFITPALTAKLKINRENARDLLDSFLAATYPEEVAARTDTASSAAGVRSAGGLQPTINQPSVKTCSTTGQQLMASNASSSAAGMRSAAPELTVNQPSVMTRSTDQPSVGTLSIGQQSLAANQASAARLRSADPPRAAEHATVRSGMFPAQFQRRLQQRKYHAKERRRERREGMLRRR